MVALVVVCCRSLLVWTVSISAGCRYACSFPLIGAFGAATKLTDGSGRLARTTEVEVVVPTISESAPGLSRAFRCPASSLAMSETSAADATRAESIMRPLATTAPQPPLSTPMDVLMARADGMIQRAQRNTPLTESEVHDIMQSITNVLPLDAHDDNSTGATGNQHLNHPLRQFLLDIPHLSHKNWSMIQEQSERLGRVLFPPPRDRIGHPDTDNMLRRILIEGKWHDAAQHALAKHNHTTVTADRQSLTKPFAVLVTGVNGIRKTTSLYQPWFSQVLKEAIIPPQDATSTTTSLALEELPTGHNSFFRQLDHIIATMCNHDFSMLYRLTAELLRDYQQLHQQQEQHQPHSTDPSQSIESGHIPQNIVDAYSHLKGAIFTRYRTLSELLGAWLLTQAKGSAASGGRPDGPPPLNCLLETSGRDVAMFRYVDQFFPATVYHKLALRFQINALDQAMVSVDQRMKREIADGCRLVESTAAADWTAEAAAAQIWINAGGPYGSHILPQVQKESDRVWEYEILNGGESGNDFADWYKATIQIYAPSAANDADPTPPWTAQAIRPDGSLGTVFEFIPPVSTSSSASAQPQNGNPRKRGRPLE